MPNLFVRCMLFVSSYCPLALICSLLLFDEQRFWALLILLLGLSGCFIMLLYFLVMAPKKHVCAEKVTELQKRDGDVMSYAAGYLIAFITFPLHDWQHIAAVLIFHGNSGRHVFRYHLGTRMSGSRSHHRGKAFHHG